MITEYETLMESDEELASALEKLDVVVQGSIEIKWEPFGSPAVAFDSKDGIWTVTQAVVLRESDGTD